MLGEIVDGNLLPLAMRKCMRIAKQREQVCEFLHKPYPALVFASAS